MSMTNPVMRKARWSSRWPIVCVSCCARARLREARHVPLRVQNFVRDAAAGAVRRVRGRPAERDRDTGRWRRHAVQPQRPGPVVDDARSEEHTSELQSLMRISYAVFCLKKKKTQI